MKKFKKREPDFQRSKPGTKPDFQPAKPKFAERRQTEERRPRSEKPVREESNESSQTVIYGVLPVTEALRAGTRKIEKILVADEAREKRFYEILELAKERRVPFQKMPRPALSRYVAPDANHQGIVAFVAAADYVDGNALLDEISAKENSLCIILDGVEDPRNLGAILRTVNCAGADGVFIPERRAAGLTETVVKTSAGATEYVKIAKVVNISRLIDEMKELNIWTVGTSADAKMNYADWDWTQKSALVLGGEGKGLHRLVAEKCDVLVKIPLRGEIESLNVSVAAGIVLYEAVRQRDVKEKSAAREQSAAAESAEV